MEWPPNPRYPGMVMEILMELEGTENVELVMQSSVFYDFGCLVNYFAVFSLFCDNTHEIVSFFQGSWSHLQTCFCRKCNPLGPKNVPSFVLAILCADDLP